MKVEIFIEDEKKFGQIMSVTLVGRDKGISSLAATTAAVDLTKGCFLSVDSEGKIMQYEKTEYIGKCGD